MQKKHWIPLAVLAAVILGAGHFLTGGDWYLARMLKDAPAPKDPIAQAQRRLTEAEKAVVEAKHQLLAAQRAVVDANRRMAEAQRDEAASRRSGSAAKPEPKAPFGADAINGPRLDEFGGEIIDEPTISGPRLGSWGFEIVEPAQTARAGGSVALSAPVFQSPGVVWNRTGRQPQAPFEIITSPGADYFVKLVEAGTSREAAAVYVQGGTPIKVHVPLGAYTVRYAYGEKWYGEKHLFGPGNLTRYSAAGRGDKHEIFRFEYDGSGYTGYTIELISQPGGNLPTESISAGQF